MTYEERVKHRDLVERSRALRQRLSDGDAPVTRDEALELASLIEEVIEQLSPERWDQIMETIVDEAARRAGSLVPIK